MVDAITDPDAVAEEACRVGLIHPKSKWILHSLPADAKTKARSLLQSIKGKIEGQPFCFHHFLALLKKLPGLADLGIILQKTYGKDILAIDHLNFICNLYENAACVTFHMWVMIVRLQQCCRHLYYETHLTFGLKLVYNS